MRGNEWKEDNCSNYDRLRYLLIGPREGWLDRAAERFYSQGDGADHDTFRTITVIEDGPLHVTASTA